VPEPIVLFLTTIWTVTAQMAPYLLLGFLIAGLLSVYVSPAWLERHLGGRGWGPIWRAALLGVPLPLCSCGVIPVAASLRRHGASKAATTSFLLSTPQTGVDSIAVTGAVLGPVFAVLRPVIALVTGLVGGGLVRAVTRAEETTATAAPSQVADLGPRWRRVLAYGFEVLPRDIGRALVVGILLAALITVLVPPGALAGVLGGGIVPILVMIAVGMPLYVCATGSVPLAASFIHAGVSPGAALAFLIAGPATNAAAFTTLHRVLGRRTLVVYLGTVAASALVAGLLVNALLPVGSLHIPSLHAGHVHGERLGWFAHLSAAVLVVVMAWALRPARCAADKTPVTEGADDMERLDLAVQGMTCAHCRGSVERALAEQPGVAAVVVDLVGGRAVVRGEGLDAAALIAAVEALGFRAAPA
jgi:uncharacterized membrane protein YraQ (UPF0718 family)/copper chaperone CopZ